MIISSQHYPKTQLSERFNIVFKVKGQPNELQDTHSLAFLYHYVSAS